MERVTKGLPSDQLAQAFEQAFSALWRRAHQTLGDVTLAAIVDRVLYTGAERFPVLGELKVEGTGLRWAELRQKAHGVPRAELADAIRFVLVEFLTVLGNLTADILTPALHAELRKVASRGEAAAATDPKKAAKPLRLVRKAGKDAKS
jgi:hypothetical protein